jgi:hypothetical protein
LPKQKTLTLTCPVVTFTLPSQENHQVVQVVQNAIKYNDNFKLIWSEPTVTTTILHVDA